MKKVFLSLLVCGAMLSCSNGEKPKGAEEKVKTETATETTPEREKIESQKVKFVSYDDFIRSLEDKSVEISDKEVLKKELDTILKDNQGSGLKDFSMQKINGKGEEGLYVLYAKSHMNIAEGNKGDVDYKEQDLYFDLGTFFELNKKEGGEGYVLNVKYYTGLCKGENCDCALEVFKDDKNPNQPYVFSCDAKEDCMCNKAIRVVDFKESK
ncbi:MAG: hypothetical protein ACEPOW_05590 [Bacteroidales bacterium]